MKILEKGTYHGVNIDKLAFNGLVISHNQYPVNSTFNWHSHENPHFTFILRGKSVEKRKNGTIHCLPGTLLFYPPHEPHCNEKYQHGCKSLSLEIEEHWLKKYDLEIRDIGGGSVVDLAIVKANFSRLVMELKLNDPYSKLNIEGLLLQSIATIKRKDTSSGKRPFWIEQVKEVLHEHLVDTPSLTEIGKIVNIHPVTISKEFPKYFHCTIGDYIRNLRIEKSMSLLGRKSLALDDIAFQCGFYDTSHFTKVFRKNTGLTPTQYRGFL